MDDKYRDGIREAVSEALSEGEVYTNIRDVFEEEICRVALRKHKQIRTTSKKLGISRNKLKKYIE